MYTSHMAFRDSFKLTSAADMEAEKKRIAAEKTKQHWLSVEKSRTTREKYEIKEISGWMYVGAFLGLLMAVAAGLLIWASGADEAGGLWWFVGIGIAPLILFGIASTLDDDWKASVAAKEELHSADPRTDEDGISRDFSNHDRLLHGHRYKYDHLYTDSPIRYYLYILTKFILGLSTIAFGIGAAILLFMWLGTISIAPTTIIIILLVMILLK